MIDKKNSKSIKRIVRDLQSIRDCSYQTAINELRSLPEGTNWKDYVMRVALQDTDEEKE